MNVRGLLLVVCALSMPLACGKQRGPVDLSKGPTDLAAFRKMTQDKATMERAERVAAHQYYDGKHYYRIATTACDTDPNGEECRNNAALAKKRMEEAVAEVKRRDFVELNEQTKQTIAAITGLDFTSGQQRQQQQQKLQQQEPETRTLLKHRALWREVRNEFGTDVVTSDLNSVTVTLQDIFKPGTAELKDNMAVMIAKIAEMAVKHSEYEVLIQSYTDSTGSAEANLRISTRRAEKIQALLVQNQVEEHRITSVGYGESLPVADDATEAGRALNRRIEIVFIK